MFTCARTSCMLYVVPVKRAKMYAKIGIMMLLFVVLAWGQKKDHTDECQRTEVLCTCHPKENLTFDIVIINTPTVEWSYPGESKCYRKSPEVICERINCRFNPNSAGSSALDNPLWSEKFPVVTTMPTGIGSSVLNNRLGSNHFPVVTAIPAGPRRKAISKREVEPCMPHGLANADVTCWKWPTWITCQIRCGYGHALNVPGKGSQKIVDISCRPSEYDWKPSDYSDCSPYLNCQTALITKGTIICLNPVVGPPSCNISCQEYENHKETPVKTYTCADASYKDQLPHCARLKDVELIPEP